MITCYADTPRWKTTRMLVELDWTNMEEDRDPLWADALCLYVYLHPERDWLLYIGKADHSTVRQRLHGDHKAQLWREYEIATVRVMHGDVVVDGRRTSQLLSDVETLLIKRLRPFGNIQSTRSRISRRGMRVHCLGDWPFKRWRFHDVD
ncbi:MAG: hypothetical protein ACREU7_07240 [Burkholderiales bacterium]